MASPSFVWLRIFLDTTRQGFSPDWLLEHGTAIGHDRRRTTRAKHVVVVTISSPG